MYRMRSRTRRRTPHDGTHHVQTGPTGNEEPATAHAPDRTPPVTLPSPPRTGGKPYELLPT
eukprot:5971330-Prymnesium_polylepis.1